MRPEQALAVIQFEPGGPPPAPDEFRSAAWTNAEMRLFMIEGVVGV
jgi:hypothetical protein